VTTECPTGKGKLGMNATRALIREKNDYPAFATTKEAADYLKLSRGMVHKLIADERMPATKFGRAVRIPWTWLRKVAESSGEEVPRG